MATSAFKSTTKRSSIGASVENSASSNRGLAHRRSYSVSRFSRRIPAAAGNDLDEAPAPRGRFVNTVRDSGYPNDLDQSHKRNLANLKSPSKGSNQIRSSHSHKPEASNHRQGLRRSFSENDLSACDGYTATGIPKPTVPSNSSDQIVFSMLRNYATKFEECQKRQQDLLSEALLEQQRSRELSKIVKELLPEPRNDVIVDKPSQGGALRGCTERNGMSKKLSEEAERHVDDFISNVEDMDISPLDGEKNDMQTTQSQSPSGSVPLPAPADMDGVRLPWLQWETSIDASPAPCMDKIEPPTTPKAKTKLFDVAREMLGHMIGFIPPPVAAGAVALVFLIRRRGKR